MEVMVQFATGLRMDAGNLLFANGDGVPVILAFATLVVTRKTQPKSKALQLLLGLPILFITNVMRTGLYGVAWGEIQIKWNGILVEGGYCLCMVLTYSVLNRLLTRN